MRKVIVVGGGIGGLTAAIALRRVGLEVTVLERAVELREVGAGLLLGANAIKALKKFGLDDAVREIGVPGLVAELRSWRGEVLFGFSESDVADLAQSVGAESFWVHRADLQAVLVEALGTEALRLGAECTGFEQDAEGVRAFLRTGEERGDLLVGADGIHSRIRGQLFGGSKPRYAGYTAWRGLASSGVGVLPWGAGFESWGRGRRFGCAHVGRGRVYWFATRNAPEGEVETEGRKSTLLEMFRGWHEPVEALIRATEEGDILRNDIYDREPIERWGRGRVTLLGDAAHPMTPDLGQGACQAIEDAVVLARCLGESEDPITSLRLYEERRAARTATVVRRSRRLGQVGQLENPILCRLRDALVRRVPLRVQRRQFEEILGYEA